MKKLIKNTIERFGFKISRISDVLDAFQMQKKLVEDSKSNLTIFDVGACEGSVALTYNNLFPHCKIFCFEPFPESFSKLKSNTSSCENIISINKGLGEFTGTIKFHSNSFAPTNSILASHKESEKIWGTGILNTLETIDIELITIDDFIQTQNIKNVDILKLDVQGSEYMVINGAKDSLRQGKIKMIYTEIINVPTYEGQKYLDEIFSQLRINGFDLFNFYNFSLTTKGQLRQFDAIFTKSN